MSNVHQVKHPVAQMLLTAARPASTAPKSFADQLRRIGYVLAVEVTRNLKTKARQVITPLSAITVGDEQAGRVALVPVLRAGVILEEGFRTIIGNPHVWHLGMDRNETTLQPTVYLNKVPCEISERVQLVVVLEVMLATGGSACAALNIVKNRGAKKVAFVCVVAAPEGIARVQEKHPDVDIYVVAIDERLTDDADSFPNGYIVPGLGDAGDRINGTL